VKISYTKFEQNLTINMEISGTNSGTFVSNLGIVWLSLGQFLEPRSKKEFICTFLVPIFLQVRSNI